MEKLLETSEQSLLGRVIPTANLRDHRMSQAVSSAGRNRR